MGVYIKGMEMPDFGDRIIILTSSGYVEDVSGNVIQGVEAAPVPPHGRLGDLDDFIKRMTELMQKAEEDDFALGAAWYGTFIRHIELTPTVIPAEEGE